MTWNALYLNELPFLKSVHKNSRLSLADPDAFERIGPFANYMAN